jgi:hypothetical protein
LQLVLLTARSILCALATAACSYSPSFDDCAIQCSTPNGCPSGFACGSEGLCRVEGASGTCDGILDGGGDLDSQGTVDASPSPDAAWTWDGLYTLTQAGSCYIPDSIEILGVDGDGAGTAIYRKGAMTYSAQASVTEANTIHFTGVMLSTCDGWDVWDATREADGRLAGQFGWWCVGMCCGLPCGTQVTATRMP